jgi:hypothetical protein
MPRYYHPNRNQVIGILRNNGKTTNAAFRDSDGRIYGFIDSNQLVKDLIVSGEVDEKTTFLMWVFLPYARRGPYSSNDNNSYDRMPLVGEDLQFPRENSIIDLLHYRTGKHIAKIEVLSYPEKRGRGTKTDSVIVAMC